MVPTAAAVAALEPEIAAKNAHVMMATIARPPEIGPDTAVCTSPETLRAVIREVKKAQPSRIIVAESAAIGCDTMECFEGKVKIPFPIIADISMNVARKYGMLQTVANTQTVRAVFIIDPEGMIRTILYYPMSTGRNIPEIIRILQSLQLNDKTHYSTPANWQPGDAVVMGAPLTIEEAQERLESSDNTIEHLDWYLTMKKMK